jgi:xylulokinase
MKLLGLDIGSSSVKAAVLNEKGDPIGEIVHRPFDTRRRGVSAEVEPDDMLGAVAGAIRAVGAAAKKADFIALSVMSPAWVAMDKRGKPLTPIVTHQDRRSTAEAKALVAKVGKKNYQSRAANLPIPGGISASTLAWYHKHHPEILRKADLIGHLNTFLHRQITGARVIDPANASFTGLYRTLTQGGWDETLCEAAGAKLSQLPEIKESNTIGGAVTKEAAQRLALRGGTPMVVGIVDTSSAMLLAGATPGKLLNVSGSTDVLGLCTEHPKLDDRLLLRALGIGRKWMAVSTLAAAGSSLAWAKDNFFPDLDWKAYSRLITKLSEPATEEEKEIRFEPYLAGLRTAMDQPRAAFTGLTLATTREDMLHAIIEALAESSAARLPILRHQGVPIHHDVMLSGGTQDELSHILHRDWPGKWKFHVEKEATLRGLVHLQPASKE